MLRGEQLRAVSDEGLVLVDGRMDGALRVTCQRCLEPVEIRVAREIRVALVKAGDETAVARIVHLVEEATHRKAAVQTFGQDCVSQFIW